MYSASLLEDVITILYLEVYVRGLRIMTYCNINNDTYYVLTIISVNGHLFLVVRLLLVTASLKPERIC